MNKIVLVTGATGDIGYDICHTLSQNGYDLIIHTTGKDGLRLQKIRDNIDSKRIKKIITSDFSSIDEVEQFCHELKSQFISIDCIINNAGIGVLNSLDAYDNKQIKKIIDVNLIAPIIITKELMTLVNNSTLKRIINMGSTAALGYKEYFNIYCASKHGLEAFTSCMYHEFKINSEIRVTNIHPGMVETNLRRKYFANASEKDVVSTKAITDTIIFILEKNPYITDITIKK